jgi:hypothetical protein
MKKFILLTVFFIYNAIYTQNIDWGKYAKDHNPSTKNELSLYFKKEISKNLLKKTAYFRGKNNIILSFNINNEDKPYNINVSTFGSNELRDKIKSAFKKYPLEKLNLNKLDRKNRYSLQIISKKGTKNIFNCSSNIMIETPTICKNCEDFEDFEDIETCLEIEVKKHIYNTFDFSKITEEDVYIYCQYKIKNDGSLSIKNTKKAPKYIDEIKKGLSTFSKIETQSTFNNKLINPFYNLSIDYKKSKKPIYKDSKIVFNNTFKPSTNNEFSKYLSTKLSSEIIEKGNLNRINNSLKIYFELNNTEIPFNITTNSRSTSLENEIISAFKKYPIKAFNITDKSKFNRYSLQILSFNNNQTVISTNTLISYLRPPVFPGCENSSSIKDVKKCFSKGIQQHFVEKFDASLPNKLGLSKGRKRIFIGFKIDKEGDIVNIKVRAPHIVIKNEVIRVMKQLPKVSPGAERGKNVNIKYSIPFTIVI